MNTIFHEINKEFEIREIPLKMKATDTELIWCKFCLSYVNLGRIQEDLFVICSICDENNWEEFTKIIDRWLSLCPLSEFSNKFPYKYEVAIKYEVECNDKNCIGKGND